MEFDCNLRLPFLLWWGIMLQHSEPVFKLKFDSSTKQACGEKKKKKWGGGRTHTLNIAYSQNASRSFSFLCFSCEKDYCCTFPAVECSLNLFPPLHLLHLVSLILYQLIYKIIYSMNNIKRLGEVTGLCAYLITIVWGLWGGWREEVDALYTVIKKK